MYWFEQTEIHGSRKQCGRKTEKKDINIKLPTDFQELLKGNFGDMCSFLYALYPVNINKETMNILGSAHIFAEKKQLRQKLASILKSWFFHPEVFILPAQKKKDASTHEMPIEMGFIDKLGEMYKIRKILRDLKQEMEHSNGGGSSQIRVLV